MKDDFNASLHFRRSGYQNEAEKPGILLGYRTLTGVVEIETGKIR
jgi:hypothetical protein